MPLSAAVWRKLAIQRSNPASASAGDSEKAEAKDRRHCGASKAPDGYVETHLFLLREYQEDHSSPTPVRNQFTMLARGNENAANALFAGHEFVTSFR